MRSNVWGRWVVVCFENVLHHAGRATTKALFYLRKGELSTGEGRFFFVKSLVYRLPKHCFSAVEHALKISADQLLERNESTPAIYRTPTNQTTHRHKTCSQSNVVVRAQDVETTIRSPLSIAAASMNKPRLSRKHR
jgi:hypothetical protein